MKIGILTFQYVDNYGAVLQAYALRKHLITKGYRVDIINYNNSKKRGKHRKVVSKIKTYIWSIFKMVVFGNKKKRAFDNFRTHHLEIKEGEIKNREQLNIKLKEYDAVIVGSDQVWNPSITGYDKSYLLDFDNIDYKISYAASIGKSQVEAKWLNTIVNELKSFKGISVREKTARDMIIATNFDENIKVVLDPVFLLEDKEWNYISEECIVPNHYILCYIMPGDNNIVSSIEKSAKMLSKKHDIPIVYLGRKEYKKFNTDGYELINASPREFIGLFSKAEMVLTNSFHGTAFSIIFQKNFYSFVNSELSSTVQLGSRIKDLLDNFDLSNRCVCDEVTEMLDIEYSKPYKIIEKEIQESKEYLDSVLKKSY